MCSFKFLEVMCDHEELFETISQALISSIDRDCLSGWGGHVYIV
ncbi:putative proteasome endopeptidase complex [Helianthus anomalus]